MGRARRERTAEAAKSGKDPLVHGFCLLAAVELGKWPAWSGPREVAALRRRVETLAILLDVLPRAELHKLDRVLEHWAARFPERRAVSFEKLRNAGRSILHLTPRERYVKEEAAANSIITGGRAANPEVEANDLAATGLLDSALSKWTKRVTGDRRWTHLPAIVPGEPSVPISEIFVELFAVPDEVVSEDLDIAAERAARVTRRLLAERQPAIGVATLVARTLERCIVVGEPGSGKSTLIQWLAHATYRGLIPDYDHAVVVKLSAYAKALQEHPHLTLLEFFFATLQLDDATWTPAIDFLRRRAVENRRHLLLLDGWDEVPLSLREFVREQILDEARHFVTIITSRPSGLPRELRDNGRVDLCQIAGLTPRAIEELTGKLLRRIDRFSLFESILRRLRDEPDFREMAANPFLLGLLVRVLARTVGQAAPRCLADVYGQIASWMQEQYNRLPTKAGSLKADHLAILGRLSFGLLCERELPRYVFSSREINACLAGRTISQRPIQQSRFITKTDADFDEYRFLHATLQEYLAATHLTTLSSSALDGLLERSFWSASRLIVLEFAAGIEELTPQCRRKAAEWFRSRDRFHHVLLRLSRILAAGRWRSDDLGREVRRELWQILEAKENASLAAAAAHAFAELDPVELVNCVASAKSLDFLHLRNLLEIVPRSLIGPETVQGILDGPWRDFANLVVVKADSAEELALVRKTIQDRSLDPEVRTNAVRIAGMSRDGDAVPALLDVLRSDDSSRDIQSDAVDSLGRMGGRQAVDALVDLLVSDNRPKELAGHASAALSLLGSAALDPAGRDRVLRRVAASEPESDRLGDMLYALMNFPIGAGADVIADIALESSLASRLRVAAVQVVGSATDIGVVRRLAAKGIDERDETVAQSLCRLSIDRSATLPDEWLEEQITTSTNDARRVLCLTIYLFQLARKPSSQRVRGRAFVHRLATAALASGGADAQASRLSRALSQPEPSGDGLLGEDTLELARRVLSAFTASDRRSAVDQLILAANVCRHFPGSEVGGLFRSVFETAMQLATTTRDEPMRDEWNRLAGYIAALLAALAPGELLRYPPGCAAVDNALCEISLRKGWLIFGDRIIDSEGRPIAAVGNDEDSAAGEAAPSGANVSQKSAPGSIVASGASGSQHRTATPGIERMGDRVIEYFDALVRFRRIGQICRDEGKDGALSLKNIGVSLAESDTKIREVMASVSLFFREYFQKFEGLVVARDDSEDPAKGEKLFERVQGRPFRIYPLGWRAWELACRYLALIAPLG